MGRTGVLEQHRTGADLVDLQDWVRRSPSPGRQHWSPGLSPGPGIEESWCRHRRDRYRAGGCTQQSRILLHSVAHRSARTTRGRGLLHSDTNISRSPQVKQRVRCAKVSRF